ncbi:MAG: phosphoribosylformylglycinamidine cyclo-ligase [Acetobacteraceae bacterium]|nr:phosphoribosylformylglycinamidine cyclo-ligase [Acetobacteraceae bacterium]
MRVSAGGGADGGRVEGGGRGGPPRPGLTYGEAGVDRSRAREAIERVAPLARLTHRPGVVGGIGAFGGFFDLGGLGLRDPVLVAGADGVGTKLVLAQRLGRHWVAGWDLVAMNVNDVLVHGAQPLFFLDYIAMGRVEPGVVEALARGMADACREAGCALLGGETAEMPGVYGQGEYELAGFCVGVVERPRLLTGSEVAPGDAVLGVGSSGLHSNGFALARRALLERAGLGLDSRPPGLETTLGEALLAPTRVYARAQRALLESVRLKALAHITGGGLLENLPRVLPPGLEAVLSIGSWQRPGIFGLLSRAGVDEAEMFRTFNMGLGMVAVVPQDQAGAALGALKRAGETAWVVGGIRPGGRGVVLEG